MHSREARREVKSDFQWWEAVGRICIGVPMGKARKAVNGGF